MVGTESNLIFMFLITQVIKYKKQRTYTCINVLRHFMIMDIGCTQTKICYFFLELIDSIHGLKQAKYLDTFITTQLNDI